MANKKFWSGMLIMALVFGTVIIGCDTGNNKSNVIITYTVEANGTVDEETSSQLYFTFDAAVDLRVEDIAIIDSSTPGKAEKNGRAKDGALTGSGTSWTLNITKVTAGKIRVQITKAGIERGRKTVTVHKDNATGEDSDQAITLASTLWEEGSLANREAVLWYKFEAEAGKDYRVQWKDKFGNFGSESYEAVVKVTAYKSDHTTIISDDINEATGGYEGRPISGVSGTVYLKVELAYFYGFGSFSGSFAIRIYDPALMGPQDIILIYSVRATIVPSVVVSWEIRSEEPYESSGYKVYRSDTEDGTYTQVGEVTDSSICSYVDTTVKAGKTYWYKIAGYNSKGEGEKSEPKESEVVPAEVATVLTFGVVKEGDLKEETQVDWYKFTAEAGKTYTVQWESRMNNHLGWWLDDSPFSAVIQVSAFSDKTPIDDFQNVFPGWDDPKTISGLSGTVYLKVEVDTYPGTYTIKVTQE